MNSPTLLTLETVEAPHPTDQGEVKTRIRELFAQASFDLDEKLSVFDNTGIQRRTFSLPLERYLKGITPAERGVCFTEVAGKMLHKAVERAVPEELRSRLTHIVTVTTSGVATPSLECELMPKLDLALNARRVPVFGLGCAGGVAGLQTAGDLARSRPDALVLFLCVELTSLTHLASDRSLRNFVACALFGDGAAAGLIAGPEFECDVEPLARIDEGRSTLFPDSLELMGWDIREEGWAVIFSPRIPALVRRETRRLVDEITQGAPIDHYVLHPGGQKILEAYGEALDLDERQTQAAREVLRDHGNMSAATVLFCLQRILSDPDLKPGPAIASAFGPGFSADLLRLELLRSKASQS